MAIPDEGGGSSYLIDYNQMTDLGFALQGLTYGWGDQLQDVGESIKAILGLGDFRGAAADSTKGYLTEVHAMVLLSLGEIISEINTRFLLYKDGYLASVDSGLHARLDEDVIQDTFQAFDSSRNGFDARHASIQRIAESISDIMGAQAPSPHGVSDAYSTVLDNQKRLHEGIVAYESEHVLADFANLDLMVGALLDFIDENLLRGASGVTGYVPGSITASRSFQTLSQSLQNAYNDRAGLAEDISLAANREQQRLELLEAEWAKQREEEGWLNLLLGGLIVVGGIICIVATAGLATPLVVAGAVAGGATILYGSMNMVEAGQDIYYGSVGDYSTAAFNPLRDTVFEWAFGADGKQQAWDAFGTAAIVTSSVLSLGAGAYGAYGQGVAKVAVFTSCPEALVAGGIKGVVEFSSKAFITIGAGAGAGYAGHEIALYYGASETVADIVSLLSGTAVSSVVGYGMSKWQWSYEPGSMGIPEGVCFTAGTLVLTIRGPKPIEDIIIGDWLISTNVDSGETAKQRVLQTYIRQTRQLVHIWLGGSEIQVTPDHLFFSIGKGWVKAIDLDKGDQLTSLNGDTIVIDSVSFEQLANLETVYNLDVDEYHTYYAGLMPILVHNADYASNQIPSCSLNSLPDSVQDSFNKYDQDGWNGNVAGQSEGTSAGGRFMNRDGSLPTSSTDGSPITYKEFDVNNNIPGTNRDPFRFVVGSDGSKYYTTDHYQTFVRIE
ncbi:MAG: polymorphic toxin-type HINT domain-containing protein [Coriobacteriia bacterium]|nr:polymorphic toxin-type HINT domain-containing protein [Coriobacteriia bacterium]